ncbi:VPA1269 family protein [Marinomonas lutimaris]|uniref:VPA1269 family protein n=1 Tax=Marinomonas lutimaris TaxID=2846746 RepID=UPI001CA507A5|nr:VPA1269 family protein [Marinomonas lutimaris]
MNNEVFIYENLNDEEIARCILDSYGIPEKHKKAIRILKARAKNQKALPIFELVLAYQKLSLTLKKKVQKDIAELFISDQFHSYSLKNRLISDRYENIYGPSTKKILYFLSIIYDVRKLEDITLEIWKDVDLNFRGRRKKPYQEISKSSLYAYRKIAATLDSINKSAHYRKIPKVIRMKRNIVDINSTNLIYPQFNEWLFNFQLWVETLGTKSTKDYFQSFRIFLDFLFAHDQTSKVVHEPILFASSYDRPSFYEHLKTSGIPKEKIKKTINYIQQYIDWFIFENLADINEDDGDIAVMGYQLFSQSEVISLNRMFKETSKRPIETPKRIMPTKWILLCKQILKEDNFAWPKSLKNQFFERYDNEKNEFVDMWNPILTYTYLIMLELPLRKIQVICLDSGEGDSEKFDHISGNWLANEGPHACYWKRVKSKRTERGFINKIYSQGIGIPALYINTNKTADIGTGFGENSGYIIPWSNSEVIKLANELRDWQEKYNPVTKPKKYADISSSVFSTKTGKVVSNQIPDRFYLFRNPESSFNTSDEPPSESILFKFWFELMAELENRLKEVGEYQKIITKWSKTGQPETSIFTPHGLRAAGLTSLIENGVPIEILSKIVAGHTSIIMTLHYIKFNPAKINDILNGAQKKLEDNQQGDYANWLKSTSYEDALKYTVTNNDDSFFSTMENKDSIFETNAIGICPYSGTRCSDGGQLIRKIKTNKSGFSAIYGSVEAGDCLNCRHFITGAPWLIPLWLKGNKLLEDSKKESESVTKTKDILYDLQNERYKLAKSSGPEAIPKSLKVDIKKEEALLDFKTKKLDKIFNDIHKTHNLIQKINTLSEVKSTDKSPIFISDQNELNNQNYIETSNFRMLDLLVRSSSVYSHIFDESLQMERNKLIDQFIFDAGVTPISFLPLTENQKITAHNAASEFLANNLNDFELKQLEQGHLKLPNLGFTAKELTSNIKKITGGDIPLIKLGK